MIIRTSQFHFATCTSRAFLLGFFLFVLSGLFLFPEQGYADDSDRFFWMGSGKLHLVSLRNGEEAQVNLLNADGSMNDKAFTEIDRVFGFPTKEKGEHISPRMLFMLSYFSDLVAPGKTVMMESGYRSPAYNDKIRKKGANAARTSTHIDGMALDFWIEGVDGKQLWETVRAKDCCGVGHYGGKSIHLDSGRPRFWEAATSGTRSKEPDHNRHVYVSTDFDRYAKSDRVRLAISGVSNFRFGVRPVIEFYHTDDPEKPTSTARIRGKGASDCIMINDRKASRFLYTNVPSALKSGKYRAKISFCKRPFEKMPAQVVSNILEIY